MPYHIAPDIIIDATLYTLLAFSLITWTLIFFKIWQFAKNSSYNKQYNSAFWDATSLKSAKQLATCFDVKFYIRHARTIWKRVLKTA